ncbi:MAG: tRNA-binding protein [Oligoflexales bacterium]|nr:tRNA-binding protein [Oligoflexales bacterium]
MITYEDFSKIDIRAGIVVKTEEFPRARNPAYKVWVDFGHDIGVKATSAQITKIYTLDNLLGRKVLGVVNIGQRNIAGFLSNFLLLGFPDKEGRVHLAGYDDNSVQGARLC